MHINVPLFKGKHILASLAFQAAFTSKQLNKIMINGIKRNFNKFTTLPGIE